MWKSVFLTFDQFNESVLNKLSINFLFTYPKSLNSSVPVIIFKYIELYVIIY